TTTTPPSLHDALPIFDGRNDPEVPFRISHIPLIRKPIHKQGRQALFFADHGLLPHGMLPVYRVVGTGVNTGYLSPTRLPSVTLRFSTSLCQPSQSKSRIASAPETTLYRTPL